jgi:DNA-binding transcriptional ArsR family regulator
MRRGDTDERAASNVNRIFFALADPTRRDLLDLLYERDGRRLRDLACDFDMSRQAVSKHLDVLADAGLIVIRRGEHGAPAHFLNRTLMRHVHSRWMEKYLQLDTGTETAAAPQSSASLDTARN